MNPTELRLNSILENRDDNLEEINKEEADGSKPSTGADDDAASTVADVDNDNGGDSSSTSEEEDTGFTANDLEQEVEEPVKPEPPTRSDPEIQYIADNLPDITARIVQDGKVSEISVKSWTQLPQDVEFASKRDELAFVNAVNAQEIRAQQLRQEYRTNQSTQQAQDFETRENAMIRDDITKLQNESLIPKFKVAPNESGFESDEGYKSAQEVLEFMNKKNEEYLATVNKGGAYRHIGFEEAYYMMPKTQKDQAKQEAQKTEDTQRKQKATNVAGNQNNSTPNIRKATVAQGTSLDDIVNRVEQEW